MVKWRGVQIYKRRGSLACVASGTFFSRVVRKVRDSAARKMNRGRKRKLCMGGGGAGGRGKGRARVWIPASLFFFSRLSFRNYLSCVFNCDDLLGRSVVSSPRSSTEVIVVLLIKPTAFWRSTFVLYQTVHGNDWLCTEAVHACFFFFVALWLLGFVCLTSASIKFVWMSLDRPTRSIRLLQTNKGTSEDRLQDKRRSSHATN